MSSGKRLKIGLRGETLPSEGTHCGIPLVMTIFSSWRTREDGKLKTEQMNEMTLSSGCVRKVMVIWKIQQNRCYKNRQGREGAK